MASRAAILCSTVQDEKMASHSSTEGGRVVGGCSLTGESSSVPCRLESRERASTAALWSRNIELRMNMRTPREGRKMLVKLCTQHSTYVGKLHLTPFLQQLTGFGRSFCGQKQLLASHAYKLLYAESWQPLAYESKYTHSLVLIAKKKKKCNRVHNIQYTH